MPKPKEKLPHEIDLQALSKHIVNTEPCNGEVCLMVETHRPLETREILILHSLYTAIDGNNTLGKLSNPSGFYIKEGINSEIPVYRNVWVCKTGQNATAEE